MAKTTSNRNTKRTTTKTRKPTAGKPRKRIAVRLPSSPGKPRQYGERSESGRSEIEGVDRTIAAERRRKARRMVRAGHGDESDRS
jgi:hypothetical protein